jgi:NADH-quinone oxidoreductase subunit N
LTLFMFSLSGIPPLAGFWGKFTLFAGAIGFVTSGHPQASWFLVLAVVAALNAAIGAGYYLRVIGAICFGEPTAEAAATARPTGGLSQTKVIVGIPGLVCGMLVVLAGLMPNLFLETTAAACSSAHHRSSPSPILQQPVPGSLAPSLSSQARR